MCSGVRPSGFGDASVGVVIWALTKPNILTVGLLVAVLSTACSTSNGTLDIPEVPTVSYLENDIPPCVPIDQSTKDPCAQQTFAQSGISKGSFLIEDIPAYWELYYSEEGSRLPVFESHLVIRATLLPDTVRCAIYAIRLPHFALSEISTSGHFQYCFIDVRVNDYLIGTGPAKLSVIGDFTQNGGPNADQRLVDSMSLRLVERYEGVEAVLFFNPSFTTTVEAWLLNEVWDVQELDGTVKVVSPYLKYFEHIPENLPRLIVPLTEFEATIAQAATTRAARHEGRTGASPNLPMFVTDANLLRPYYEHPGVGVSYETNPPALPPPIPGQEERPFAYSWDCGPAGGWWGSC